MLLRGVQCCSVYCSVRVSVLPCVCFSVAVCMFQCCSVCVSVLQHVCFSVAVSVAVCFAVSAAVHVAVCDPVSVAVCIALCVAECCTECCSVSLRPCASLLSFLMPLDVHTRHEATSRKRKPNENDNSIVSV